ncbi:TIGR03915 family putative DNA repair protein [bacterium]|nr:TIGR03915 family putative DNA repair protein [bacterium]
MSGSPPSDDPAAIAYDGSFLGFLCAVADALNLARAGLPPPPIQARVAESGLFDETVEARRDDARAASLWGRLSRRLGDERMRTCLEAFCSDFEGRETALAAVLARALAAGPAAFDDLNDPATLLVARAARRAGGQAHLVSGLVRFAELADGSWYAPIEPDCDVLPLVAEHFAARYADMAFVIHDRRRRTALVHRPGAPWALVEGFELAGGDPALAPRELELREGWRGYFTSVSIAQRENRRLQASHMPKKYWRFLPEMAPARAAPPAPPADSAGDPC